MTCQDCLRLLSEVSILWTAPNGETVCGDCYEVRTGKRPLGLRELNEQRRRAKKNRYSTVAKSSQDTQS